MRRFPTFESPTRADALAHVALLLWSLVSAAFLVFLVLGGEAKAPESWNAGVQVADGFYQLQSLAALAFLLGSRRARKHGLPMHLAPVIGRGFVLTVPWVMLALVLWIPSMKILGYVVPFAYELVLAPLVAALGLPVLLLIGARWVVRPSAHTSAPSA